MTFDSPFSAVLLAVWGNLPIPPRFWSKRGLFCTQIFVYGLGCCRASAYAPGFGQIAAVRRRSERRRRVPVPHALTLED